MSNTLRFIAISGTTDVTENLYVYEYLPAGRQVASDIIVVDCGVGFPEEATYGVDLVIPDFSYLVKNKDKIRGVFISHGHEDHFGAIPFFLDQVGDVPIYTSKLVAGFINDKLADYKVKSKKVNIIDPSGEGVRAGQFLVDAFRVTHSVPDSLGFCITTPVGRVFHVSDYKFDWTPVDGKTFDIARAARLAEGGVLALASDSLGATSEGYTKSEREIEQNLETIVEDSKSTVYFTTISSNISRMQQAIDISQRQGRKVSFVGRSIEKKADIARGLGLLKYKDEAVVPVQQTGGLAKNGVTYIISGSYGQVGSALYRVATGEHDFLKVGSGDVVIFSSDPAPPGTEQTVNFVVDSLIGRGADVHYYDTQEDLHVSGHGSQKEIEMLFALLRPRYLLPIGGTIRHMRAYRTLAERMGWGEGVFELLPGESVEFSSGGAGRGESRFTKASRGEKIKVRDVLVDGLGVGDVGEVVLSDRKTLAKEGVVIVVLQVDSSGRLSGQPKVVSRGFVYAKEHKKFLKRAGDSVGEEIRNASSRAKLTAGQGKGGGGMKKLVTRFLSDFFFAETGRRPMILPVIVRC